jgi:hypothetical protein
MLNKWDLNAIQIDEMKLVRTVEGCIRLDKIKKISRMDHKNLQV